MLGPGRLFANAFQSPSEMPPFRQFFGMMQQPSGVLPSSSSIFRTTSWTKTPPVSRVFKRCTSSPDGMRMAALGRAVVVYLAACIFGRLGASKTLRPIEIPISFLSLPAGLFQASKTFGPREPFSLVDSTQEARVQNKSQLVVFTWFLRFWEFPLG
jgi:hypothetical protein